MVKPKKVEDEREEKAPEKHFVYVHEPGTVHLNAYEVAVQEAEKRVAEATAELEAAKQALKEKKANSKFVEE